MRAADRWPGRNCDASPSPSPGRTEFAPLTWTLSPGKDGRFEVVVCREGIAKLSIIPVDHCMKHIEIGDRRGDLGDVTLASGVALQGIVQDAAGAPARGFVGQLDAARAKRRHLL